MELKNYFAQTSTGTVISGATFYVYKSGTTTLAAIYDKNGVALANPSTATTQGLIQFKAVDGSYDVTVKSGSNSYTIPCTCFDGSSAFRECLRRSYAEAGYALAEGSFGAGATLQSSSDVLLNEQDNKAYSWAGAFPHTVSPGTDPSAVGSGYVPRSDVAIRGELSEPGANGVISGCVQFETVSSMSDASWLTSGTIVKTLRRSSSNWYGGGMWQIVASSSPDGFAKIAITGTSLMAAAIPAGGVITAESCGVVDGDASTAGAAQSWLNRCSEVGCKATVETVSTVATTGLTVRGGTIVDFGDAELFLVAGSNKPIMSNENKSFTTRNDYYISITARRPFNCNEQNQTADITPTGELLSGVCFVGVENLHIDFDIQSPRRYAWWFINCKTVTSSRKINCYHTHASGASNKDGFHINGNCSDFYIPWVHVEGGHDDTLPINADDVNHGGLFTASAISGPITNINIGRHSNRSSYNGIRLLSANSLNYIDGVSIGDCDLEVSRYALNVEHYDLGSTGVITGVKIGKLKWKSVAGSSDEYKGVFINSTGAQRCEIEIDGIRREQVSSVPGSVGANTVNINYGANTHVSIGNITEVNCGDQEPIYIKQTVGPAFISIGDFISLPSTAVKSSVVKITSDSLSNSKGLYSFEIGNSVSGAIDKAVHAINSVIGDIKIGSIRSTSGAHSSCIYKAENSNLETIDITASPLMALGGLASGAKTFDLDSTSVIASKGGMFGMSAISGSPSPRPSTNEFMWSHKGGVTKMIFYRGDSWVDALGNTVTP